MEYTRTLDAFRKGIKIARREIEDDQLLGQILSKFLELEGLLKNGTKGTDPEHRTRRG